MWRSFTVDSRPSEQNQCLAVLVSEDKSTGWCLAKKQERKKVAWTFGYQLFLWPTSTLQQSCNNWSDCGTSGTRLMLYKCAAADRNITFNFVNISVICKGQPALDIWSWWPQPLLLWIKSTTPFGLFVGECEWKTQQKTQCPLEKVSAEKPY